MESSRVDDLANESVGKLLFRLAVPAIAAQLVNMLYNIVEMCIRDRHCGAVRRKNLTA